MTALRAVEVVTTWGGELLDVVYVPPARAARWAVGVTQKNHLTTEVRAVAPVEPVVSAEMTTDWWFWSALALSAALHAAFIVMLAFSPHGGAVDASSLVALPLAYLGRLPDPIEVPATTVQESRTPDWRNGGTGTAHAQAEGIGLGDTGRIGHGGEQGGGNGFGYPGDADISPLGCGSGAGFTNLRARDRAELVVGGLSREVIRRVIARHRQEVSYCYEQELARRPDLAGRVVMNFVIGPSGAVQGAAVKSTELAAPAVEACITDAVQRWAFPAPVGGGIVVVDYPFVFQSTAP